MSDLAACGGVAVARSIAATRPCRPSAARAELFERLAAVFAGPPSAVAVAALRSGDGERVFAELSAEPDFAPAAGLMASALAAGDDAVVASRLGIAFGRLFLGIGGPSTVAPYESVHTCGGRLWQAPAAEMERLLAAHDLKVTDAGEPADHLAIEVALLARLVGDDDPDRAALADRLAAWVPDFGDLVIAHDDTGWFAGAVRLLLAAIDRERLPTDVNDSE